MMTVEKFVWRVNLAEPKMERKEGRGEGGNRRGPPGVKRNDKEWNNDDSAVCTCCCRY